MKNTTAQGVGNRLSGQKRVRELTAKQLREHNIRRFGGGTGGGPSQAAVASVVSAVQACKCGSTQHTRTNHRDCRLNKLNNKPNKPPDVPAVSCDNNEADRARDDAEDEEEALLAQMDHNSRNLLARLPQEHARISRLQQLKQQLYNSGLFPREIVEEENDERQLAQMVALTTEAPAASPLGSSRGIDASLPASTAKPAVQAIKRQLRQTNLQPELFECVEDEESLQGALSCLAPSRVFLFVSLVPRNFFSAVSQPVFYVSRYVSSSFQSSEF